MSCNRPARFAIFQAAQQLDDLGVKAIDAETLHGVFTGLHDIGFNLDAGTGYELFDARRVDASVLDQAFECHAGDLATNRIKGGN